MMSVRLSPEGAKRIEAAHGEYIDALRELNNLRCERPTRRKGSEHPARIADARRRADEALARWVALYQQETGRRLNGAG